jgi:hypothetical protein
VFIRLLRVPKVFLKEKCMVRIINVIFFAAYGYYLAKLGFTIETKEFWTLLGLTFAISIASGVSALEK